MEVLLTSIDSEKPARGHGVHEAPRRPVLALVLRIVLLGLVDERPDLKF